MHGVEWAAGFFEGEGHVRFTSRNKDNGHWLTVQIAQVYREPLDAFQQIFKAGKVYGPYGPYGNNKQPYFQYAVYGEAAETLLEKMLPYLFRKGEQAQEALTFYKEYYEKREAA